MKRDDRFLDIVHILRDGRLHTAAELARALGVSSRTIWRDVAMLAASGIPIEGERGIGYMLKSPLLLPPLSLAQDELDALVAGLRHVSGLADDPRARAARALLIRIATLLPQAEIETLDKEPASRRP